MDLIIRSLRRNATEGTASIGSLTYPCALGRNGITSFKREGDSATPAGRWRVIQIHYRPDRLTGFRGVHLQGHARLLRRHDGWCDAVGDRNYNRQVKLPYRASAEALWRDDHLYDVIIVLDHNHVPRIQGAGSAIFMHLAGIDRDGSLQPTAGCVALKRHDLAIVMRWVEPGDSVVIVG